MFDLTAYLILDWLGFLAARNSRKKGIPKTIAIITASKIWPTACALDWSDDRNRTIAISTHRGAKVP